MLTITIPETEYWNETAQRFQYSKPQKLVLEHSLVSLSKWEAKWQKPFMSKKGKTQEELIDYIRCMTITQNVDESVYKNLTCHSEVLETIIDYIKNPMTATTFTSAQERRGMGGRQVVTAEIIYYWMIQNNIPIEFQKWHLNRLMTLIKVCNVKNGPKKKMPKNSIYKQNRSLNAQRRARMGTRG